MLAKFPKSFIKLKRLRHFDISDTPLLKTLPLGIGELKSLHTLTKIIIGGGDWCAITRLKGLTNLHGKISIEGLHNVQSVNDAQEANLSLKRITELELKCVDVFDRTQRNTLEEEVFNELKPDSKKLRRLNVEYYQGKKFPIWVGDSSFRDLVHVSIVGCRKCASLPPLGQLCSLKELFIQGMNEVVEVDLEFIGTSVVAFPALELLRFDDMPRWVKLSPNNKLIFPCLRELQIKNCPKLINITLKELPLLRVLIIHGCAKDVLICLVKAASLITRLEIGSIFGLTYEVWAGDVMERLKVVEEVSIVECNEIRYLWRSEANASSLLVNLKKLKVSKCPNLLSLGEKDEENNSGRNLLLSLRMLEVYYCDNIERLRCPYSIERLWISYCKSLKRVSFPTSTEGAHKLKSLVVSGCYKLMEDINNTSISMLVSIFISGWRNLKSIILLNNLINLTNLVILDCQSLESFPDIQLSNVTHLMIKDCQRLESFPDHQLSKLISLKYLGIAKCPSIDARFPRGHWPPNMSFLEIGGLKKPITKWSPQNFPTSLVDLRLYSEDVSDFSHLSDLLPSSLTQLHIKEFLNLQSLSMGLEHLTSLQRLLIQECPKMKHLPKTLLPSLLKLEILECRILKERCNGRHSPYRPLISHIPCINII